MKIDEKLLVFKAPFAATSSFEQLALRKHKGIISMFSLGITLSLILLLSYVQYSGRLQHLSFAFKAIPLSIGFIFKILVLGITSAILTSRIFNCPIRIVDNLAIITVSSLPLILGPLIQTFTVQPDPTFGLAGLVAFGILASYGIKTLYKNSFATSLLIIIGILTVAEFIELAIFGIPITCK